MRVTLRDMERMTDGGDRIAMVTADDHPSASMVERAGAGCSGQAQVWHDILGLGTGRVPRHAKFHIAVNPAVEGALEPSLAEVASGAYPTAAQGSTTDGDAPARTLDRVA